MHDGQEDFILEISQYISDTVRTWEHLTYNKRRYRIIKIIADCNKVVATPAQYILMNKVHYAQSACSGFYKMMEDIKNGK